jgi:site-specific DNA-methyltransferase (adenine-specific)
MIRIPIYKVTKEDICLINGDCLKVLHQIPDNYVDMVLCDPPYGTTKCKWDSVIPFDPMWIEIKRVTKQNSAIILFGVEPFSSKLRLSNIDMYKYDWIWRKNRVSHFAQAPYRPLTVTENIMCFSLGGTSKNSKNRMYYIPQGTLECKKVCSGKGHSDHRPSKIKQNNYIQTITNYPNQILDFKTDTPQLHPTQKPVALLEYLIKTYTNPGQIVLDFTMGSGSTGVACVNTNRKFIGIELDNKYFSIAENRIYEAFGKFIG